MTNTAMTRTKTTRTATKKSPALLRPLVCLGALRGFSRHTLRLKAFRLRQINLSAFAILLALILCGADTPVRAAGTAEKSNATETAPAAQPDPLLRALQLEMARSKSKLKMDNVPAPYYIEYRVTALDAFEASATFGALRSRQHGTGRFLRVVVRIGDYKQDSYYSTGEGTVDLAPLDDDIFAIRHRIWLATDRAYKAAGEALSAKQSALKQLKVDTPVDDFAPATPVVQIDPLVHLPDTDFAPWLQLLEDSSALYRSDPQLKHFESSLRFEAVNHYFVNSEGTIARYGSARYAIAVSGSTQAADGMRLQRSHEDEAKDLSTLPTREQFLQTSARLLRTLKFLRDAPVVAEEYRGPVLFSNDAAASVVAELIAPNILGKKPKLRENARTTGRWSSSYKTRVLPDFIDLTDDPSLDELAGQPLFGNYSLDDEGVKAVRVPLVEKGQLISYLIGRAPIRDFPSSNGHGRATATGAPEPRPGNLILQSTNPQPDADLKKQLLDLARQRGLPYAIYVETLGPHLEPRLIYRIYTKDGHQEPDSHQEPDARQELIRGAVFGDLDERALRGNLIAAGTAPFIENHLEPVPHSIVSPALLFDELQIKPTQATKQSLPEYPPPPLK